MVSDSISHDQQNTYLGQAYILRHKVQCVTYLFQDEHSFGSPAA